MSKGSKRRIQQVPSEEFAENWDRIFARKGKGAKATQVHLNKKREEKKNGNGDW